VAKQAADRTPKVTAAPGLPDPLATALASGVVSCVVTWVVSSVIMSASTKLGTVDRHLEAR